MIATSAPEAEARETLIPCPPYSSEHEPDNLHDESQSALPQQTDDGIAQPVLTTRIKQEDDSTADNSTPTTLRPTPQPSAKRTESEAAVSLPELSDQPSKKRKRGPSPPWQFPTAENSTFKTADGRRVSARVNSGTPNASESEGRGRSVSQPGARSRPASPPWKRFDAQGPTSIQIDGVRKSGRVNKDLAETPKRVSPRTKKQTDKFSGAQHGKAKATLPKNEVTSIRKPDGRARRFSKSSSGPQQSAENTKKIAELQAQIAALQPGPQSGHKYDTGDQDSDDDLVLSTPRPKSRKMHRLSNASLSPEHQRPSPKIKLRNTNARRIVPPPHPRATIPPLPLPPQLSLYQVIEKYELFEMQQPYSENERGPPGSEYFVQRASRQAAEEGAMRRKLLKEARDGGALSEEHLSLFRDERQREPLPQHGHNDHLVAHALFLRQLQQREKLQHRTLAKKLALEAVEYWRSMHGPTEEDMLAEQTKILDLIKKQVVADMKMKWEMVAIHVQSAKRAKYEADQEARRAEKLRKKLEWSENLLARQRGLADSDTDMDEDSDEGVTMSEEESEQSSEENMSNSESEPEDEGDHDEMDDDALAAYLAQREAEPHDIESEAESQASQDIYESLEQKVAIKQTDADEEMFDGEEPALYIANELSEVDKTLEDGAEPTITSVSHTPVTSPHFQDTIPRQHLQRDGERSRSTSPNHADATVEDHLSSDESTDMDSESYDSDEDMSSTGDEDGDADDDDDDDDDDDHETTFERSIYGFLDPKEFRNLRAGGLPTPVTSVENGGDNDKARSNSEAFSEGQGESQAAVEANEEMNDVEDHVEEQQQNPAGIGSISGDAAEVLSQRAESPQEVSNGSPSLPSQDNSRKDFVPQPSMLRGVLRSYQHAGLDWLASLYRNGTNGILADEMGLGKTIQTIALLAHLAEVHEVWETHLIIVPNSVVLNWVAEFQKFLPGFRVLAYYGTAEERLAKRRHWTADPHTDRDSRGYNVVVMSYEIAVKDINSLRVHHWHYLILDEAHNIRNFQSLKWQLLIRLRTKARLLLTGTPLQNNLTELWALLTFLTAGDDDRSHGELEEFMSHWKDPVKEIFDQGVQKISEDSQKIVHQLHISLRPFLLRRRKDEVEKDLPKKIESVVVCKLSKRQRQLYQDYMGLAEIKAALAKGSGIQASSVLLSLRKVCNHPDLFDPRPIQTSFAMERSPLEYYSLREQAIRRMLGVTEAVPAKLLPAANEGSRRATLQRSRRLAASGILRRELNEIEGTITDATPDATTLTGSTVLQRLHRRERRLEQLRACIQLTDSALRDAPIYGADICELVSLRKAGPYIFAVRGQPSSRRLQAWPALGRRPLELTHQGDLALVRSTMLHQDVTTLQSYADVLQDTIVKFTFVPPAVTVPILNFAIPPQSQELLRRLQQYPIGRDFAHEARIRTSIAFPDSRLLIYDSGKLQRLTYLLRDLQAKGSRTLIFTQMVGTLDILEQFLNLLNLPYLRLDGATPLERRQLYTAEFNRPDSKYQCMILSSRAGGVGLNLTGASSVIFYDLDWNPQMDRQCMDRAHRIGQSRDVEVFKMVSEKTVEENILRRANQKSLLDQTVIQEGQFTTEYQQPVLQPESTSEKNADNVEVAIERLFGAGEKSAIEAFESVEDREDVLAAQQARKEDQTRDEIDFTEQRSSTGPSKANTPGPSTSAQTVDEERKGHVDYYMIGYMEALLKDVHYVPPPVRRLDKHGRDPSHRPKRKR